MCIQQSSTTQRVTWTSLCSGAGEPTGRARDRSIYHTHSAVHLYIAQCPHVDLGPTTAIGCMNASQVTAVVCGYHRCSALVDKETFTRVDLLNNACESGVPVVNWFELACMPHQGVKGYHKPSESGHLQSIQGIQTIDGNDSPPISGIVGPPTS